MSSPKVQRTIPITLAIVGGIIVTGFASKLDDPLASVSSSKSYQSPALGSIDLQGACSVTPDVISCWNADGVADSTLTEKIKAFYIVESSNELRFPPAPRDEDATLAVVESASYQVFDQWMDVELERLVARWIHAAAPNANRRSLKRERAVPK